MSYTILKVWVRMLIKANDVWKVSEGTSIFIYTQKTNVEKY